MKSDKIVIIVVYFRGTERSIPFPTGNYSVGEMLRAVIGYKEDVIDD